MYDFNQYDMIPCHPFVSSPVFLVQRLNVIFFLKKCLELFGSEMKFIYYIYLKSLKNYKKYKLFNEISYILKVKPDKPNSPSWLF